jgi:hypothetical protein
MKIIYQLFKIFTQINMDIAPYSSLELNLKTSKAFPVFAVNFINACTGFINKLETLIITGIEYYISTLIENK